MESDPAHRVGEAILVAALGRAMEQRIGGVEGFEPRRVARVDVEDTPLGVASKTSSSFTSPRRGGAALDGDGVLDDEQKVGAVAPRRE